MGGMGGMPGMPGQPRGEVNNKRYYEVLGVSVDATETEIKKVCVSVYLLGCNGVVPHTACLFNRCTHTLPGMHSL